MLGAGFCVVALGTVALAASVPADLPHASRQKRVYVAQRLSGEKPVIDGKLSDNCWLGTGGWQTDYRQLTPRYEAAATHPTEIKILYDDRNVYVAIRAHDDGIGGRSRQAGDRDGFVGDIVGVNFDSYHDQRTGFEFDLTASGQKIDLRLANTSWDKTWNAVWDGKVAHEEKCWTAEFLIPLSQLRYDPKNTVWGLHSWRWIDRLKEESDWNLLANDDSGFVKSFGELHGLVGLRSARRVELLPYSSLRVETAPGRDATTDFQAGLDAKIGLTSNVTLDASILPDFGQVEADAAVMNLTAFETFLTEKRPLFLEGKHIFDFELDGDQLFYSRRIGQAPGYQPGGMTADFPGSTTLLGALKLSGKTGQGFSFGALGSLTDQESVTVSDVAGNREVLVAPRAAQLVFRGQQDFRQGDTVVGGIVTHVRREIETDELAARLVREATAAGVDVTHFWASREYFARALLIGTQVEGDPRAISRLQLNSARYFQRPIDGGNDYDPTRDALTGSGLWLSAGKASKGRWRWTENFTVKTPGLEFNDLGYLAKTDRVQQSTGISYLVKEPKAWYRAYELALEQFNGWTTRDEHLGSGVDFSASVDFKNKWNATGAVTLQGEGNDPVALRGGPMLHLPQHGAWSASVSTNGSKKLSGKIYAKGTEARDGTFDSASWGAKVTVRPWPALLLSLTADATQQTDRQRNLGLTPVNGAPGWFVSRLAGESRSLAFRAEWNVRPEVSVQFYANPFGSTVRQTEFRRVVRASANDYGQRFGAELPVVRAGGEYLLDENADGLVNYRFADPDANGASYHSNFVLKWEYRRGSMLYFVWAQQRNGADAGRDLEAWSALSGLRDRAASNQFMVKLTYWFSS